MKEKSFKRWVRDYALAFQGMGEQLMCATLDGLGLDGDRMAEIVARLGVAQDLVDSVCDDVRKWDSTWEAA